MNQVDKEAELSKALATFYHQFYLHTGWSNDNTAASKIEVLEDQLKASFAFLLTQAKAEAEIEARINERGQAMKMHRNITRYKKDYIIIEAAWWERRGKLLRSRIDQLKSKNGEDLDPDIQELVDKNFDDLIWKDKEV